jgi:hypothetical protein
MMRQTGGCAVGETSTKSRVFSRAILSASKGVMMPNWFPSSSITRTSRTRMRSLVRIKRLSIRPSGETYSKPKYSTVSTAYYRCEARQMRLQCWFPRLPGQKKRATDEGGPGCLLDATRSTRRCSKLLREAAACETGESDQARAQQNHRAWLRNGCVVVQIADGEVRGAAAGGLGENYPRDVRTRDI